MLAELEASTIAFNLLGGYRGMVLLGSAVAVVFTLKGVFQAIIASATAKRIRRRMY